MSPDGVDRQLLKGARLDCLVPLPDEEDAALESIKDCLDRSQEALAISSLEQREWLFFDETIDIYLVLTTHVADAGSLDHKLQHLDISVDCQVNNTQVQSAETKLGSEIIFRGTLESVISPLYVVHKGVDAEDEIKAPVTYIVWKLAFPLARPRMRLQSPTVSFIPTASLRQASAGYDDDKRGYLESAVPAGRNLLEPFASDPFLKGVRPQLSANRVMSVAPITRSSEVAETLKGASFMSLNIFPAIHTRVRFHKPTTMPPSSAIIAVLEIDFTPFFDCEVDISKIDISLPGGKTEDLNQVPGLMLPLTCVAHDHVSFMYRLTLHESDLVPLATDLARSLEISIECTALIQPGVCTPKLCMAWSSPLDFTTPVNPGFASLLSKSFQRSHRPQQLSLGEGNASLAAVALTRPDALPSLQAAKRMSAGYDKSLEEYGITMTFTPSEGPIYPGDEFVWSVFVVNRSSAASQQQAATNASAAPGRKLALVVVPKRRRNENRALRAPSTSSPRPAGGLRSSNTVGTEEEQIADAALDDSVVYAMQRSSVVDCTEVVCLSPDVRVGPLAPNASHMAELRFRALREGIASIECVRVVDMVSQEHVDLRDLPIMLVERRPQV